MKWGWREWVLLAGVTALVTGVYWLGIRNIERQRTTLGEETARMQSRIEHFRRPDRRPGSSVHPAEVREALRRVDTALPACNDVDALLAELTAMAQTHGLALVDSTALPVREETAFCEQPIRVNLHGSFEAFYGFLLTLEGMPRVVRVTGLDLTKVTSGGEPMNIVMELSLFFRIRG